MKGFYLLLGALMIAAAIAITNRYSIIAGGSNVTDGEIVWRLDRWTGSISRCQTASLFCQKISY